MRTSPVSRVVTAMFLGLLMAAPLPARAQEAGGTVIVVLDESVADPAGMAAGLVGAYGAEVLYTYTQAFKGYAARVPEAGLAALQADPRVRIVSADAPVSLAVQTVPTGVDRIDAEPSDTGGNTGEGVNVAVIDTGIDTSHRDLRGVVAGGKNCSSGDQEDFEDRNGHGTHVAGIIAAQDNRRGVVGVAPGASLWAVRVLDDLGNGTLSTVICGLDFVTANAPANGGPIRLANLSLGGFGEDDGNCGETNDDALHRAICRLTEAGVTVVVAAGNAARDAAGIIPAAYDEVVTVSAIADSDGQAGGLGAAPDCRASETDDTFAAFSNFGADVDIAAPGVCINSTWLNGDYKVLNGTSMAAPHVTGAAALVLAANPDATPADVRAALLAAAQPGPISGDPDGTGEGVVNAGGY